MLTRFRRRIVEKPWGRTDIPSEFGDLGGRRVGEIWFEHPDGHAMPLMAKFLFTAERLSIQVHPDFAAAQAQGHSYGKDECWLVLDALGGAELGVGPTAKTDVDMLRRAALDGTLEAMIDWRPAKTGDFVYNPAGTIHAIGAGLMLVEVQQNTDCTYRLYDYGRARALHLDEGLAVAATHPHHDARDSHVTGTANRVLVDGPHFHLLHLAGEASAALLPSGIGDYGFLPLSSGCAVATEKVALGECAATRRADRITLAPDARALLFWPA